MARARFAVTVLALLATLVAGAALMWRDHATAAADEARRRLLTWRVAGTTTSRIDAWLAERPYALEVEAPGLWADEVEVVLTVEGTAHHFAVERATGSVRPADEAARSLVARIRAASPTLTK